MFITYRIGENQDFPIDRDGREITEETSETIKEFKKQTEIVCGQITVVWSGPVLMPLNGMWWSR